MGNAQIVLREWCIRFLENRDAIKKEIESVLDSTDDSFRIKYKTGIQEFLICMQLDESFFQRVTPNTKGVFVLQNNSSITFLIKEWKEFCELKNVMFYFSNPFSKRELFWIINPSVHNQICDPESLEKGIHAMAEMVDYTSEKDVEESS